MLRGELVEMSWRETATNVKTVLILVDGLQVLVQQ